MATATLKKRLATKSVGTRVSFILAVLYLRRSDKKQAESIEQQRDVLTKFAAKPFERGGITYQYKIVDEYLEDGISGDAFDKRHSFQRMLTNAGSGEFQVILCWDIKRFGRFDSLEAGYRIYPLRQADIRLVTHKEGEVDWNSLGGRVNYAMQQESANADNVGRSADVLRGQVGQAEKGSWVGSIPYGYILETVSVAIEKKPLKKLAIGRKDFFTKKIYVGDKTNSRIIKRIFREFIGPDNRSLNNVASRLNADGIDSPGWGKKGRENRWTGDTVKSILENPAYIGTFVWNRTSRSQYHHYTNGEHTKGSRKGLNPESDWIVIPNNHPAIVTKAVYDKAQAKLAKGKTGRPPHTPESNPYLFQPGLLVCSRCGKGMWGQCVKFYEQDTGGPAEGRWSLRVVTYECSQRKHHKCGGTVVKESEVLDSLADYLRTEFGITDELDDKLWEKASAGTLTRKDLPAGFDKLKRMMVGRLPKQSDTRRADKERKSLDAKLHKAIDNLVLLDSEYIPAAQKRILTMKQRLEELNAECREQPSDQDINGAVLQVLQKIFRLSFTNRPHLVKPAIREILNELESMTVYTNRTGKGNGTRHTLKRAEFKLKPVWGVRGKSNPHQPD